MRPSLLRLMPLSALLLAGGCVTPATAEIPVQGYEVVHTYPHDPTAFTEGLFYRDGQLFESTGRAPSDIRIVRLEDGVVLTRRTLDTAFFGEGIIDVGDRLISLTWTSQIGFIWDREALTPMGAFSYPGEGWALTRDDTRIIMSDGTPELRFLDPQTLAETGRLGVTADGEPVEKLNELEWVEDADAPGGGFIYANIWQTDRIARIDPTNGHVVGWIDLSGLFTDRKDPVDDVPNGIAWDAAGKRLFVTGKDWPSLFEIRLVDRP
ncbi:glutaminyl-peptide cyclotransferase [soil metagenome]